jgi:hypothetical protein
MRRLLPLLLVAAFPSAAFAANVTKFGTLFTNETWDASNTYTMTGDVTVAAGVTLTVAPGTQVVAAAVDVLGAGTDPSRVELIVLGKLNIGSGAQFSGAITGPNNWYGIEVKAGGNATITGAGVYDTFAALSNSGSASVTGSQLGNTGYGLISDGQTTIDSSRFFNGTIRGAQIGGGTTIVRNQSTFENFSDFGLYQNGGALQVQSTIFNACGTRGVASIYIDSAASSASLDHVDVVNGAGDGLRAYSTTSLSNSIIASNGGNGVYVPSTLVGLSLSHNDIWNNTGGNYSTGITPDGASISSNPLFFSTADFHLQSNSPARKADSSGNEQGALPYNGTNTTFLEGTLYQDTTITSSETIYGDLVVPAGVTLTIAPGVTLTASVNDAMKANTDTALVELIVFGTLVVNGGQLAGARTGPSNWYGIEVKAGGNATITGAGVSDTVIALSNSGSASVTGSQLGNTGYGLVSDGQTTIDSSRFFNGSVRGAQIGGGTTIVRNQSTFENFSDFGLYQNGGALQVQSTIFNACGTRGVASIYIDSAASSASLDHVDVVNGGGDGLRAYRSTSLSNAIIANNGGNGLFFPSTLVGSNLSHNDIWNNTGGNYSTGITPDSASISSNPLFVSTADFHLQSNSPARLAGTAGSDLGALPYGTGTIDHIVVSPGSASVSAGSTRAFSATAFDVNSRALAGVNFTWSATAAAGIIDSSGTLTASCAPSIVTGGVTASAGGISGSANLTITAGPVATVAVTPAQVSVAAGGTQSFTATTRDACGNNLGAPVTWTSGVNAGTVTSAGVYTAPCATGTSPSAVTATANGVSASASVTVTAGDLASVAISPTSAQLTSGATQQFTATGADGCGDPRPVAVTWNVVNGGGAISASGLFTAATAPGTYAGTVQCSTQGFTATATVIINSGPTVSSTTGTTASGTTGTAGSTSTTGTTASATTGTTGSSSGASSGTSGTGANSSATSGHATSATSGSGGSGTPTGGTGSGAKKGGCGAVGGGVDLVGALGLALLMLHRKRGARGFGSRAG